MSPKIRWKILLAEDDSLFCGLLEQRLKEDGYEVVTSSNPDGAREALRTAQPDLAVLDLNLVRGTSDVSGLEIAVREAAHVPRIVITGHMGMDLEHYIRVLQDGRVPEDEQPLVLSKPKDGEDPRLLGIRQAIHDRLVPRVFIVHGHDNDILSQVAERLKRRGLELGILKNTLGVGQILQKFRELAARAHFAVVILTGDDVGGTRATVNPLRLPRSRRKLRKSASKLRLRARQNVIFELGYFAALLGPERVLVLYEEGVERPSDYEGVMYIPLDPRGVWKDRMETELEHAGIARTSYRPG